MFNPVTAQQIWHEAFNIPGKGIWGDEHGQIQSDFAGISTWQLRYTEISLQDQGDYAKTVATSGGRFEACDIDGEVVWMSEWIDISASPRVTVQLTASETGSGNNTTTKYIKAFYRTGQQKEFMFAENGINAGNWGTAVVCQKDITADSLQIVCHLSTHYAADKVILDEVKVLHQGQQVEPAKPYDVVINELMADPSPPAGLPEVEYIELFNTSTHAISTAEWKLRINGTVKQLQQAVIAPGGYLLLCSSGAAGSLQPYAPVCAVPGFQGLLNKGALVEIIAGDGTLMDVIAYSDSWYADLLKESGGWSLERIDPCRHCYQKENWKASVHPDGGTPGRENSIYADNADSEPPLVKWAVAVSQNQAEVAFSEPPDSILVMSAGNYLIPGTGNPVSVRRLTPEKVLLQFKDEFVTDRIYILQLDNLMDECGNYMAPVSFELQWNTVLPGDLLINELLFDPYPGGEDYVEIYNNSSKIIDLSRLVLAGRNSSAELKQICALTGERRVLLPEGYLVMTRDTLAVFPFYDIRCSSCFLQMNQFPACNNDEGYVVLLNEDLVVIDELKYSSRMHSPFIANPEGMSLERISFALPAGATGNWHSASTEAGYGTPGYENSQKEVIDVSRPRVNFEPESFSPNHDGFNDEFMISCITEKPGFVANIKIFDASGRFLMNLASNALLGSSGTFRWNGKDSTGSRLHPGVYVVFVEIFNAAGELYRFKNAVVLTDIMQ